MFPDTLQRVIPLDEASKRGDRQRCRHCLLSDPRGDRAQRQEIDNTQQRLAMEAAEEMIAGDFAGLTGNRGTTRSAHRRRSGAALPAADGAAARWANGFSCLCFVLVGAPMAIIFRNADFLTSFFVCFLPILMIYYPLLILGVDQAKLGTLPGWSVWMGNVILVLCGLWLMRRVYRY